MDASLAAGHTALRKGLHHKAFEHYRTVHRHMTSDAYDHTELQEGLCVCAAKLRKEKVAVSACANATSLRERSASSPPAPLPLLMAQGEAKLFAGEPLAARATFRSAAKAAATAIAPAAKASLTSFIGTLGLNPFTGAVGAVLGTVATFLL